MVEVISVSLVVNGLSCERKEMSNATINNSSTNMVRTKIRMHIGKDSHPLFLMGWSSVGARGPLGPLSIAERKAFRT